MPVLLGSIKGKNDDLIKKIERVIAMDKKALKLEKQIYSVEYKVIEVTANYHRSVASNFYISNGFKNTHLKYVKENN